jgi:anti-sigma regulatory factor (Ser/Thr protein kinase)
MRSDDADTAPMRRKRFLRHHDQVTAARRFVTETLPRGSELCETARLLVSETVTSILDHTPAGPGHGTFEVALAVVDHRLLVEVSDDGGPARLRHRIRPPVAQRGGLQLLQTLARRWGVREDLEGRTIWFELDLPAAHQDDQPDRSGSTRSSTGRILRRWWRRWRIVGTQ